MGLSPVAGRAIRAEAERKQALANEQKARAAQVSEEKERQFAEEQRRIAVEQGDAAEERARELRGLLYVGDMGKAFHAIQEGNLGLATSLMRKYFDQPRGEDLRGWEWRYLWQLCQPSEHKQLVKAAPVLNCAVFSPDGKLVTAGGWDKTVTVVDMASKVVTNLAQSQ